MSCRRLLNDGAPMSKESKVVAMRTGAPKLTPPLVDLATLTRRLPVSGQKTKTSPALLVLASQPMAVPGVSVPLIWIAVCHAPAGPVRRGADEGGPLWPAGEGWSPGG